MSLRSGFGLHLAKPIDPAELVAACGALARQRVSRWAYPRFLFDNTSNTTPATSAAPPRIGGSGTVFCLSAVA